MKKLNVLFVAIITGILLLPSFLYSQEIPAKRQGWPSHLRILSGATGGQWEILGNAISETLNNKLIPSSCKLGKALDNMDKIEQNFGDLAFSMSCFLPSVNQKDSLYNNTVLLANLYPQVLYILLRKKFVEHYNIKDLDSLLKKNIPVHFATLKKGTGSYFLFEMLLQHGYNSSFKQLQKKGWQIDFNNYSEIVDKFADEELDGFAYTGGREMPVLLNVEQYVEPVVLSIPQKILQSLHKKFHTSTYTIQPGTYNAAQSIKTLSTYTCLVVRRDLPEDLVYSINKTIWEDHQNIGKKVKNINFLQPETALPKGVKTHQGSLKFWDELQIKK